MKNRLTAIVIVLTLGISNMYATHYRGGSIEYKNISGNTYEITLTTYSDPMSPADRDSLQVNTGDGADVHALRTSILILNNNIQKNEYRITYTYNNPGNYKLSFQDPNRVHNIINMTGSVNAPLYIESELSVSSATAGNNSATIASTPIFYTELGKSFSQNLTVFDLDGDVISYELIPAKINPIADAPGYYIPADVSLNPVTGEFTWNTPATLGTYTFIVLISECRNNQKIGSVMQEFQVIVVSTNSNAQFQGLANWQTDTAGNYSYTINPTDTLQLSLTFEDINADSINITAFAEPNLSGNSMNFQINQNSITSETIDFSWTPGALNARCAPYLITLRGESFHFINKIGNDVTLLIYVQDQSTINCSCEIFPLSVSDHAISSLTQVSPNPFKDYTIISISEKVNLDNYNFTLFDISGKKVKYLDGINDKRLKIERNGLPAGIYIYQIKTNSGHIEKGKLNVID